MTKIKKETPLTKQYNEIKSRYPDTVLLFRLGDFYETFGTDAELTARDCGITLTKRSSGGEPLAGFPHHQLDVYLPKLIRAGHRVAVCEQLEDPKMTKGIVKRDVVEVITPGVALSDRILDAKSNNFIASIYLDENKKSDIKLVGISFADISTGEFTTNEAPMSLALEILESVSPRELIISRDQKPVFENLANQISSKPSLTKLEDWIFDIEFSRQTLLNQFETKNLKGFGIDDSILSVKSAGAIVHYVGQTQSKSLSVLKSINFYNPTSFMLLDFPTRKNLEIVSGDGGGEGALFKVIDKTKTPMGGRLLRRWVNRPLVSKNKIEPRHDFVENFVSKYRKSSIVQEILKSISDLERLNIKISSGRANPKDLLNLRNSLEVLPELNDSLSEFNYERLDENKYEELKIILKNALKNEVSLKFGNGDIFNKSYNSELDEYTEAKFSAKKWIADFQDAQRERTGINSLKVGFNNVFGYYIEITRVHADKVPEDFLRRQSLRHSERYITPELKNFEEKILSAEEKIYEIEVELFAKLCENICSYSQIISDLASFIARLDCLLSFSEVSKINNYVRPKMTESQDLIIKKGRHPTVELGLDLGKKFTANDCSLAPEKDMIHIITGPNMSGKSCYLRQNALIVLLAQIGCFVPASFAEIGVVDRIFTRVGAQDNLSMGESTFLVEMQETANIINNATEKSLILLDEVGRGTATFDGLSIAWALSEYLHENIRAKTLFATHYHELNELENRFENITNFRVEVIETKGNLVFSHRLARGGSDHSFGIHVAKMAGLPNKITDRANEIMKSFESESNQESLDDVINTKKPKVHRISKKVNKNFDNQMAIFSFEDDVLRTKLRRINIEKMTPMDAFSLLAELISESKK